MARQRDIIDIEMWRDVPGFDGIYQASSHGRIRRMPRLVPTGGGSFGLREFKILKSANNQMGYMSATLVTPDRKPQKHWVHRIVCRTFHGEAPTPGHEVAHNDGVRANNRSDNLRWATAKENAADRTLHRTERRGEAHYHSSISERDVRLIREHHAHGASLVDLASRHRVTRQAIWLIVHRRNWKHI